MSTESGSYVDQFKALEQERQLLVGGIAVVIVSAFLPWYSTAAASTLGVSGDGFLTLLLAGGVAAGIHYEGWTEQVLLVGAVAGAVVALVALAGHSRFASIGLYLTAAGGVAMAIGGYQLYDDLK